MKGTLLLVDDEPILLNRLKASLEEYADQVFTAENGKVALEIIDREQVHCVLCDINMPIMNGVEVLNHIRASDNDIPFIFYTGHGNKELMLEAARLGAFDFLDKPNLDGLEEVVPRGLKVGIGLGNTSESNFVSEYAEMLKEIDKK